MLLEYQGLLNRAERNGLDEKWLTAKLEAEGMIVERVEDEVIFIDESEAAIRAVEKLVAAIEKTNQKAETKKGGVLAKLPGTIADEKDRAFFLKHYGIQISPETRSMELSPINWVRIGFEQTGELKPITLGGTVYHPVTVDPAVPSWEEANICEHGGEGVQCGDCDDIIDGPQEFEVEEETAPLTPFGKWEAMCKVYGKEHLEKLAKEFTETDLYRARVGELSDNQNFQTIESESAEIQRTALGFVDPETGEMLSIFNFSEEEAAQAQKQMTFSQAERFAERIVQDQKLIEAFIEQVTKRIDQGVTKLEKGMAFFGPGLREFVTPLLPRYKKDTFKKDGTLSHKAGDIKEKTYKGLLIADISFRSSGGVTIPKQWVLDAWATKECQPLIEALKESAQTWIDENASDEVKAVASIKIEMKVNKEKVKANLDKYNFPGVELAPVHELATMNVGNWSVTEPMKKLEAAMKRLQAACKGVYGGEDEDET